MEEVKPSSSFHTLMEEYESTKKALGEAEETLKRITGRNPDQFNGPNKNKWKTNQYMDSPQFPPGNKKRGLPPFRMNKDEEMQGSKPEEDSPDEAEPSAKKPSLQSTVVANLKDVKSRKDTIQKQNVNSKVKARNRRMLGMILGTLQKFQHEAKKTEEKTQKRAVIEQKVEAAAIEEKERLKKEKEELFLTRRQKMAQLRCLEKKMEIAELHETWESNHKEFENFILSTNEPRIYYLPAKMTEEFEKRLKESKEKTSELIKQKREQMERDLAEVEEMYKQDTFRIGKENMGPPETDNEPLEDIPTENATEEQQPALPNPEAESNAAMETEAAEDRTNDTSLPANDTNLPTNDQNVPANDTNEPIPTDQEFEPIYD